ncbi:MAG TPA: hypothetical protein VJ985_08235 [Gammaproteobacteria bacterium]|nr:hypothetical protein [Gammaproteobacteria bacterium]
MAISDHLALKAFAQGRTAVEAQALLREWTGCCDAAIGQKISQLLEHGLLAPSAQGLVLSAKGAEVVSDANREAGSQRPETA